MRPDHVLRFEPEESSGGLKPYLHVRRNLWAKVTRALFYDLVAMGEERDVDGERMFGVDFGRAVLSDGARGCVEGSDLMQGAASAAQAKISGDAHDEAGRRTNLSTENYVD